MNAFVLRLKTEPVAVINFLQVLLGVLVAFHVVRMSDTQTGLLLTAVSAIIAMAIGLSVHPFQTGLLFNLVQTLLAAIIGFGVQLDQTQQGVIVALVTAGVALFTRQNVTPEAKLDPVVPESAAYTRTRHGSVRTAKPATRKRVSQARERIAERHADAPHGAPVKPPPRTDVPEPPPSPRGRAIQDMDLPPAAATEATLLEPTEQPPEDPPPPPRRGPHR